LSWTFLYGFCVCKSGIGILVASDQSKRQTKMSMGTSQEQFREKERKKKPTQILSMPLEMMDCIFFMTLSPLGKKRHIPLELCVTNPARASRVD
jgi:hypothetical protein